MTSEVYPLHGGCACRGVRYEMQSAPMFVHCCHCRCCQRETGSAFVLNAMVEAARVLVTQGEPKIVRTPSASGHGQDISRCPICQVALWSNYAAAGAGVRFVRVGTLDEPDRVSPDIHIYTSTKLPWIVLPQGVPAVPEFYDLKATWPPASMDRLRAARAAAR